MATASVRERILQHIETHLRDIDGLGDYHNRVETVERRQAEPSNLDVLPAIHLREGEEIITEGPNPLLTRMLTVVVAGWIRGAADLGLATCRNQLLADIERAVLADATQGGLAVDTHLTGSLIEEDPEPGAIGALTLTFVVHYRTVRGNPAQ